MTAREAILVGLQGVCLEAIPEASSMSEERGKRPEAPCACVVLRRFCPFRCVPRAGKNLPGIHSLACLAEGTKSSVTRFT